MSAVLIRGQCLIVFIQLTRNVYNMGGEGQSIVIPLLYEMNKNTMNMPSRDVSNSAAPIYQHIVTILTRCSDYSQMHTNECCIANHIKELMRNDLMPS